jgi:ankyrin repeat protein
MDCDYLPINKIQAVVNITNKIVLTDIETNDLCNHVIQYLNAHTHTQNITLEWYVKNGQLELIKDFLEEHKCELNQIKLLTKRAAECGNIEIVNYCLRLPGGHQNDYRNRATKVLHIAVINNQFDLVKFLVSEGAYITNIFNGESSIITSIMVNNMEITEYLIKHNTRYNNSRILFNKHVTGKLDVIKMLIENCDGIYSNSELFIKNVACDSTDVIKYLINNFDHYVSDYYLRISITHNSVEAIEYLLIKFAEKNLSIPNDCITDEITDINRLLIQYAEEHQYDLFNPEIVKTLTGYKSARNV